MNDVLVKLFVLVGVQLGLDSLKVVTARYIIRTFFTTEEFQMSKWFTWQFISGLTVWQILGLVLIASFTLVTFPLGIWISSFKLGVALPISHIVARGVEMITIPLTLTGAYAMKEVLINRQFFIGIFIIEVAQSLLIIGWWLILDSDISLIQAIN